MTKSVIVAKVPDTYTNEQKVELGEAIKLAVYETKVLVIPNDVDVFTVPLND